MAGKEAIDEAVGEGKTFFVDTSAIVAKPEEAFRYFTENPMDVMVIPDVVWAELDNLKDNPKKLAETRQNAGWALNILSQLARAGGSKFMTEGVEYAPGAGRVRVYSDNPRFPSNGEIKAAVENPMQFSPPKRDQDDIAIVRQAMNYHRTFQNNETARLGTTRFVLVSNDNSVLGIAATNSVPAEPQKSEYADPNLFNRGFRTFDDGEIYSRLMRSFPQPENRLLKLCDIDAPWTVDLIANQYLIYTPTEADRIAVAESQLVNREQIFYYDIMNDCIRGIPRGPRSPPLRFFCTHGTLNRCS